MSSAECLAMANKFKALQGAISALHGPVSDCEASITNNEAIMENTILSGRPLDDGKLVEGNGQISSIHGNLSTMESECAQKYQYWICQYELAKAREEAERRNKRKNRNSK